MTVLCEIERCPYNDKINHICQSEAVMITINGRCKHLDSKFWEVPISPEYKTKPNVLTIVKREEKVEDKVEEKVEASAEEKVEASAEEKVEASAEVSAEEKVAERANPTPEADSTASSVKKKTRIYKKKKK